MFDRVSNHRSLFLSNQVLKHPVVKSVVNRPTRKTIWADPSEFTVVGPSTKDPRPLRTYRSTCTTLPQRPTTDEEKEVHLRVEVPWVWSGGVYCQSPVLSLLLLIPEFRLWTLRTSQWERCKITTFDKWSWWVLVSAPLLRKWKTVLFVVTA